VKIAQICPRFYPDIGGVETHVYEISRRLAKEFEVEILTTDPSGKLIKIEEFEDFKVRRFRSFAPGDAYYFSLELYRYLKKKSNDYDLIHAHNYHAFPALFAAMTKSKTFVFTPYYHGRGHTFVRNILHMPYRLAGRRIFHRADAVTCLSKFEKRLVKMDFGIRESKILVIPPGINYAEFANVKGMPKEGELKKILYVGRIEKYKGLDFVVSALKLLPENFVLEVVGKGPYKPKIIKLTRKLGVSDRVRFYQDLSREELIEKYASADVLVLLSKFESYGIVVAEALASKTPCVVAKTSALSEWIDNINVFGVSYPIDIKELADLIKRVSEVEICGIDLTSWDDVAQRMAELYQKFKY